MINTRALAVAAVAIGATLCAASPATAATGTGPGGQTLTVSKANGLDPSGETVTVHGEGYDLAKGIYVVVCVNTGQGQQPTPCLGGVDMEGGGGSSAWISSNPPPYGEGLAKPFVEENGKGAFDVQLTVAAKDEFTDCLDPAKAPNGCVIATRADHTRTADRSADVLVPISFATGGSDERDDGPTAAGEPSASAEAQAGSDLAGTGSATLPAALAGLALLGGGAAAVVITRRRVKELNS